ncbi:MAG: sulfur carrier protein ThiS [Deltaproteobacteria bacterium]|nr:sulfur carrier protein ThiS [Deltaproteobacteria bacterium]
MHLSINGQSREFPEPLTVLQLLVFLELIPERIVVELNREILTADRYAGISLQTGDKLELIEFVGGG